MEERLNVENLDTPRELVEWLNFSRRVKYGRVMHSRWKRQKGNINDISKVYTEQKIRLGKILKDHGPYAPYSVNLIILPKADKIIASQSGENVDGYKLKDTHLEYETIETEQLAEQVNEVRKTTFGKTTSLAENSIIISA